MMGLGLRRLGFWVAAFLFLSHDVLRAHEVQTFLLVLISLALLRDLGVEILESLLCVVRLFVQGFLHVLWDSHRHELVESLLGDLTVYI